MSAFICDTTTPPGDGINDEKFQAWLDKIRAVGFPTPESVFVSAHQMGSCRMSTTEKDGVVDSKGQVWGVEQLCIAHVSVFPTVSGVNPIVTVMAIADYISGGVAEGL
jgi:choline dehydrogenase-like flavoprotein